MRNQLFPGRCSVCLSAVAGLTLTLGACSPSPKASPQSAPTAQSIGSEAGAGIYADPQSTQALPEMSAPSAGCQAMDDILVQALESLPEGQAFTEATVSGNSTTATTAWASFVKAFASAQTDALVQAGSADSTGTHAAEAFKAYADASARLSDGSLNEYVDDRAGEEAIKTGKMPELNPEYASTVELFNSAHITLTDCLPHWPIVF